MIDEINELSQEAQTLLELAKKVVATTPDEYRAVGAIYADIKNKIKLVEAERVRRTGPLNESLRLINADFKAISETLKSALLPYERAMIAYKQEEERQRRAAEEAARIERERIEAECRAKAEEERQKLAELKRQAEEAAKAEPRQVWPVESQEKYFELMEKASIAFNDAGMADKWPLFDNRWKKILNNGDAESQLAALEAAVNALIPAEKE